MMARWNERLETLTIKYLILIAVLMHKVQGDNGDVDCLSGLKRIEEGESSTCDSLPEDVGNFWPVTWKNTDCYGWWYTDRATGLKERNSANNITCTDSTTISYNMYPGSLDCNSSFGGPLRNVVPPLQCVLETPQHFSVL